MTQKVQIIDISDSEEEEEEKRQMKAELCPKTCGLSDGSHVVLNTDILLDIF